MFSLTTFNYSFKRKSFANKVLTIHRKLSSQIFITSMHIETIHAIFYNFATEKRRSTTALVGTQAKTV